MSRPVSTTLSTDWGTFVAAAMLCALPLVAIQGPAHTTPMDGVNFMFVVGYWIFILTRRETLSFPLIVPFWLICLGSCGGLFSAIDRPRAFLVMAEDVYLYTWFLTLTHFLTRRCRVDRVVVTWVAVACGVALATVLDQHMGLFGGRFAGTDAVRASGTFENPNMFGDYLVLSLFLAWAVAAGGRRIFYCAVPALFLGVLATASNGAMASLVGGSLTMAAMDPRWWRSRRIGAVLLIAGLGLGATTIAVYSGTDLATALANRKRGEVGGAAGKGMEERLPVWLDAWYDLQHNPAGVGPGNFNRDGGPVSHDDHAAHNEYVGMLVERGPLGLIGFCTILLTVLVGLYRLDRSPGGRTCGLGVLQLYGALGGMAAHALVIELSHFRHTWLGFAVLYSIAAQVTARAATTEQGDLTPMREAA
jgi:O-antigen ligase